MYKGIIFDIDGVLVNSEKFYMERRMDFFKSINIKPGSSDINDFVGSNATKIWEVLVPEDSQKRERLKKIYLTEYEQNNPIDFEKYANKDLKFVIESLYDSNIKVSIASAGSVKNIEKFINDTGVKKYLDFYLSGEELKENKPDPEIYIKASDKMNIKRESLLVVEDSVLGIKSAKRAGLKVVALKPQDNYSVDQSEADLIIDRLRDLLNIIFKKRI